MAEPEGESSQPEVDEPFFDMDEYNDNSGEVREEEKVQAQDAEEESSEEDGSEKDGEEDDSEKDGSEDDSSEVEGSDDEQRESSPARADPPPPVTTHQKPKKKKKVAAPAFSALVTPTKPKPNAKKGKQVAKAKTTVAKQPLPPKGTKGTRKAPASKEGDNQFEDKWYEAPLSGRFTGKDLDVKRHAFMVSSSKVSGINAMIEEYGQDNHKEMAGYLGLKDVSCYKALFLGKPY